MAERGGEEPGEQRSLWPVVDDDDLPPEPAEEHTRLIAIPPPPASAEKVTGVIEIPERSAPRPPPEPATQKLPEPATRRMQVPLPPAPWPPPEPPRAAPVRVGPPPEPPTAPHPLEPPSPRRPGRKVALLVVVALILVAGAGTGVVLAVPGLSEKLGLTESDPEVVIAPPAAPVQFAPALRAPAGEAPAPTSAGVRAALAGPAAAPGLGTLTGAVLDPVTGETLWEQGAATPLVPASTGKLLVGAAALLSLPHTEQLTTKVVAGPEPGSVVIVGGGDPTLSSLKAGVESVYPGAAHLTDLVEQVRAAGPVNTVYVDVTRYAGNALEPSWDPRDVANGYIAPIVPAMLDGGRADGTKDTSARAQTPARALAEEFARRIGATVPAEATTTAPQGAKVLGEVRSAPVVELVDTLLQQSDNVLAETVAREVARAAGAEPSFTGASQAALKVLRDNGFDTTGLSLADASGLSGQNRVPAGLLASILAVAAGPDGGDPRTAKLRPLLGGLPVAGGSGTLSDRYNTPGSSAGRGWVRAKTGTLSVPPVNSLAGVVLDAEGRLLVFALMTNGSQSAAARPALDAIAATLRGCGCH